MIAHIRGEISEKNLGSVVIETSGIGYEIFATQRNIEKFSLGEKVMFFTHHRVKEDQNDLYGFETKEEKLFFEKLISVSGIGPKTALLILEFSPSSIRRAVEEEDIKFLSQAKGMGKKTVSRMILELKGKLPDILGESENPEISGKNSPKFLDTQIALEGLGFDKKQIQSCFTNQKNQKFLEESSDEEIMKWALRELSSF